MQNRSKDLKECLHDQVFSSKLLSVKGLEAIVYSDLERDGNRVVTERLFNKGY